MGYRRMKKRDLWEIYRRWQAGQSLSHIAANERRDRKTVHGRSTILRGSSEAAAQSKRASSSLKPEKKEFK